LGTAHRVSSNFPHSRNGKAIFNYLHGWFFSFQFILFLYPFRENSERSIGRYTKAIDSGRLSRYFIILQHLTSDFSENFLGCDQTLTFNLNNYESVSNQMTNVIYHVAYANYLNRTFILGNQGIWKYGNFDDFFFPAFQHCDMSDVKLRKAVYWPFFDRYHPHLKTSTSYSGMSTFYRDTFTVAWGQKIGEKIFKLKPEISTEIERIKQPMKKLFRGPYIVLIVTPFETDAVPYILQVEKIHWRGKIGIFVISDNSDITEQLMELRPKWNIHSIRQSDGDSRDLALNELTELEIAVKAEHVVCPILSTVCQLVLLFRNQPKQSIHFISQ
jgi:hypothetical protein